MTDMLEVVARAIREKLQDEKIVALDAMWDTASVTDEQVAAIARAAIEAMREPKETPFSDSRLPREMIEAGEAVLERVDDDHRNYIAGKTVDWDYGMVAVATFRAMIDAALSEGKKDE